MKYMLIPMMPPHGLPVLKESSPPLPPEPEGCWLRGLKERSTADPFMKLGSCSRSPTLPLSVFMTAESGRLK